MVRVVNTTRRVVYGYLGGMHQQILYRKSHAPFQVNATGTAGIGDE